LKWEFVDADDFHPPANIEKMARGLSLDDNDRAPWLESLRKTILQWIGERRNVVLACSALKRSYRELLCVNSEVLLVYLKANRELLEERLQSRRGHFAGAEILTAQFADLEEPLNAIIVSAADDPEEIVAEIRKRLAQT
jgi:gluconokinase